MNIFDQRLERLVDEEYKHNTQEWTDDDEIRQLDNELDFYLEKDLFN